MMRKIEPASFRRMSWKNGGGETAEIAIAPVGATAANFDWRVSTARVAAPGPFSIFQGIDRSLAIVSGQGLRLAMSPPGGDEEVLLGPTSEPYLFAGDIPACADLTDGEPVIDLNVMTRREKYKHILRRVETRGVTEVEGDAVVLYCLAGNVECHSDGHSIGLTIGEALVAEASQTESLTSVRIECRGDGSCEFLAAQFFSRRQTT